jgi:LPS O-antigen subunit length determinant protein (WzzB/FepE family)
MIEENKNFNNEFSLLELWSVLFQGRSTIFFTTILFLLSSIVFLLFTPKTYVAQVTITEPSIEDIQALRTNDYGIDGILSYDAKNVHKLLVSKIQNYDLWRKFIAETKIKGESEEFVGLLNKVSYKDFKIKSYVDGSNNVKTDIFLDWKNAGEVDKIIIKFIHFADMETSKELVSNILSMIKNNQNSQVLLIEDTKSLIQNCHTYGQMYCLSLNKTLLHIIRKNKVFNKIKVDLKSSLIKTTRVISYDPLSYKVKPRRTLVVILATIFGFMFGMLLTFFLDFVKKKNS